jgi:HK97 family phage portal protein
VRNPFKRTRTKSIDLGSPLPESFVESLWNLGTKETIYKNQSAVKRVIDFMATNAAQVRYKTYKRVSDTDREFLLDHPAQKVLDRPAPTVSRYKFFRAMYSDLFIYDRTLALKVRVNQSSPRALIRVPPFSWYLETDSKGSNTFKVNTSTGTKDYSPEDVVYLHGYNPTEVNLGSSPLDALREVLLEDREASKFRRRFWKNAAKFAGVIKRPAEAPDWSPATRERFKKRVNQDTTGSNAGSVLLLEESMDFMPVRFDIGDTSWASNRKLTANEVAFALGVPRSLVDLLDTGNGPFAAGVDAYRELLYSEILAPLFVWWGEELEIQLLQEWEDDAGFGTYIEANIEEKLRGSLETKIKAVQTLVGRPIMDANEGRALFNLTAVPEGEGLVVPMIVSLGGQASPADSGSQNEGLDNEERQAQPDQAAPPVKTKTETKAQTGRAAAIAARQRRRTQYAEETKAILTRFFQRQAASVKSGVKTKAFDRNRWNRELAEDLLPVRLRIAKEEGQRAAEIVKGTYDEARTLHYHRAGAKFTAASINANTETALEEAGNDPEAVAAVFGDQATARAEQSALTLATAVMSFAVAEAASQNDPEKRTKTWWSSGKPNSRHASLDGETVPVGETFSNGLAWPGDSAGPVDQVAGCECSLGID